MSIKHWLVFVVAGVALAAPISAQGVRPRGNAAGRAVPFLMVATPYPSAGADSAAAVEIGNALRNKVEDIAGRDYRVIDRATMNRALAQYEYPADALLRPSIATSLAKQMQARIVVTSTMTEQNGQYTVVARLAGVSDAAGNTVTGTQRPDEQLDKFGERIAEALEPAVKSLADGKTCQELRETQPDKAVKAARKAIERIPNHGLAHVCLAQIALDSTPPRTQEATRHLEASVAGDPLTVPGWTTLARLYQQAADTAKALKAYQQLLRIEPDDRRLRERSARYFLAAGHPRLAIETVNEGLTTDSLNPALYDLKASACFSLEPSDFACAVAALEARYAVDSTAADTLFFVKITEAALQNGDTARLVRWSRAGTRAYPENRTLLGTLNRAYVMTGDVDSSIAVTRRLIAIDTTAVKPALAVTQMLAQAGRLADAAPFVDFVTRHGAPEAKQQIGGILITAGFRKVQPDTAAGGERDLPGAIAVAEQGLALLADTTTRTWQFGNYVVGLAAFFQATEMDRATAEQKSCEMAKQERDLLQKARPALTNAAPVNPEAVKKYLGYVAQFTTRAGSMVKAFC